jgi:hypothetical protein
MADPIAWRNIRRPVIGAEVPLTRRRTVYAAYRRYWLANLHDGPEATSTWSGTRPQTGSAVGSHALVSAAYARSERWRLYAGYGYLFPGTYLRQSGYETPLRTAYLQSSFTF